MSKIFIVSKTKMEKGRICVGGIDLDKSVSVRLLDSRGCHEMKENCVYNIRDLWEIEYIRSPRPMPHSEDIKVINRKKTGILKQELSVLDILKKLKFNIFTGNIRENFEGKLNCTNSGSFFISQDNLSNYSTCFWVCDKNLIRNDNFGKIKYRYIDGTRQRGYNIAYVGLDENPLQIIPKGTLLRLSLAHWWSPSDSLDEEKCYLQLSGWY